MVSNLTRAVVSFSLACYFQTVSLVKWTPSFLANRSAINSAIHIFMWLLSVSLFKGQGVSKCPHIIHALALPFSQKPNADCRTFFLICAKCLFFTDITSNIVLLMKPRDKRFSLLQNIQTRSAEVLYRVKQKRNILQTEGRLTGLVTSRIGTAFWKVIEVRIKG